MSAVGGLRNFQVMVPNERVQAPSAQGAFPTFRVDSSTTALLTTLLPHNTPVSKPQLPFPRRDYPRKCTRSSSACGLRVSQHVIRVIEGRLHRPPLAVMLFAL